MGVGGTRNQAISRESSYRVCLRGARHGAIRSRSHQLDGFVRTDADATAGGGNREVGGQRNEGLGRHLVQLGREAGRDRRI